MEANHVTILPFWKDFQDKILRFAMDQCSTFADLCSLHVLK